MRRDGATIFEAEAIKLSKITVTSTAIGRKESMSVDVMMVSVSYAGEVLLWYGIYSLHG